jgi:ribosomal protein S18 acetylase RimI-like enzyme
MIRNFEPEDWPDFIRLMHSLHEEGAVSTLRFSERDMLQTLKRPDLFNVLAVDPQGNVVGVCTGWVEKTFFGPDLVAHQHMFYVSPEARGSIYGKELMAAFEAFARDSGAKEIWVSQATGIQVERTQRLFTALGFETVGFVARKAA